MSIFNTILIYFGFLNLENFPPLDLLVVPLITLVYFIKVKNKPIYFSLFLVTYSISDIIGFFDTQNDAYYELFYFVCNGLYILAYSFLLRELFNYISFKDIVKKFPIHLIILTLLNVYIIYVMVAIIDPILFETEVMDVVKLTEHFYNVVLLLLLTLSFINYLKNENNKALLFFCGCLAITFSEFLLIGHYYLADNEALGVSATILNFSAFLLLYFQNTIQHRVVE